MSSTPDRLGERLAPEEPLRAACPATISDDVTRMDGSVGVTDRRLLCVSDDGASLDVGYDGICAIRSRPRTARTYEGYDYRVPMVGGIGLAAVGFVGLLALASSPQVPLFVLLSTVSLAGTAYLTWIDDVTERLPTGAIEAWTTDLQRRTAVLGQRSAAFRQRTTAFRQRSAAFHKRTAVLRERIAVLQRRVAAFGRRVAANGRRKAARGRQVAAESDGAKAIRSRKRRIVAYLDAIDARGRLDRRASASLEDVNVPRRLDRSLIADLDGGDVFRRFERRVSGSVDGRQVLPAASGLVAAGCFVVAATTASSLLSIPIALLVLVGATLATYAHHRRDDFEGIGFVHRNRREVSVRTADGRTVHIESDSSVAIDRELSRLAFATNPAADTDQTANTESADVLSARS